MPDSTLDLLSAVQQRIRTREQEQTSDLAMRDELLRQAWLERIPQGELADRMGLSLKHAGDLRRRARQTEAAA